MIFTFASNLSGRHGAGSAREARLKHGAIYGQGTGRQGNSYAIPTKDHKIKSLPLDQIEGYVFKFIEYAKDNQDLQFKVVKIGCGLAGYTEDQIAPMFKDAPENCNLPQGWRK